jgi:hypothetical protein
MREGIRSLVCCVALSVALTVVPRPAVADLIVNGGFENVPSSATGQGLMPSNWVDVLSSADTYSNDGSYGLSPFPDFAGVTAHAGIRWVAGGSTIYGPEEFGQLLSAPLVPGQGYQLSAYLHEAIRSDLQNPGSYEISLQTDSSVSTPQLVLGTLGPYADSLTQWQSASLSFVAPTGADTHPFLLFTPVTSGPGASYPGLDDVSLNVASPVAPEPNSASIVLTVLTVLGGVAKVRRSRARDLRSTASGALPRGQEE